jgi:hypothetical protein
MESPLLLSLSPPCRDRQIHVGTEERVVNGGRFGGEAANEMVNQGRSPLQIQQQAHCFRAIKISQELQ